MQRISLKILAFVFLFLSLTAYVMSAEPFLLSWTVWVFLLICINLAVWQKLMRLATFTMLVIWSYAVLGNLIPQSTSGPSVALGDIERTPDEFIAAGDAIFHGKGKCATCHTIGGGATESRCPDLANVGSDAASRKPGMSAKEYFVESLYLPSVYLVSGYGKIMPEIWKPPIALTPLEIETVVAFLQSQGGEPDLTPIKPPVDISAFEETPQRELKGDPEAGRYVFVQHLECIKCHQVGEEGGQGGVGPDLTEIGALNTVDYIEESILEPNANIVSGYGWTMVSLADGRKFSGTVVKEDEEKITLLLDGVMGGSAGAEQVVAKEDILVRRIRRMENILGQGYFWVQGGLKDGTAVSGTIIEEDEATLTIKASEDHVKVAKPDIDWLEGRKMQVTSKMPKYDEVITIKQFEDLLAYLASLNGSAANGIAADNTTN
ncbi:MAG: c-type cytochrome [bacterium]